MLSSTHLSHARRALALALTLTAALLVLLSPTASADVIGTGTYHSCAIGSDGAVKCWGYNAIGSLGNGTLTGSNQPVNVSGLKRGVSSISVKVGTSCAVLGGTVSCWGSNAYNQLGVSEHELSYSPTPMKAPDGTGVAQLSNGGKTICALRGGGVRCWGDDFNNQLGRDPDNHDITNAPLASGISQVASGGEFVCAIFSGAVKCWGGNGDRMLGSDSYEGRKPVPEQVPGLTSGATQVAASGSFACAIAKGAVTCWGGNYRGELGGGTASWGGAGPVQVKGISRGATAVSTGSSHACAIVSRVLSCWGANDSGQLGDGTTKDSAVPLKVKGLSKNVTAVSAGGNHTCAIDSGVLKCWGDNSQGQLGNGTQNDSPKPVNVRGVTPAAAAGDPVARASGKAKVKGKKVSFKTAVSFVIPDGASAKQACSGKVTATTKPSGVKKAAKASGKVKAKGSSCTTTLSLNLPKKFKGKKVKLTLSFSGNKVVPKSKKTVSYKVK